MSVSVHILILTTIQGTCSDEYSGFDGCPVLLAADVTHYCRTELDVTVQSKFSYVILLLL